jgi:hypothetical protein
MFQNHSCFLEVGNMKGLPDIFCSFVMKFRSLITLALYPLQQVKVVGSLVLYLNILCCAS